MEVVHNMAVISFNIEDHTAQGLDPNIGHVVFTPTRIHTNSGGGIGTTKPFTVKYDKSFDVELANTSAEWLWKISVNSPTPIIVGYYAITNNTSFAELIAVEPDNSWWVKLNQLINMGGGPAGKDGKDGKDGVNGKLTTLVGGTVTKLPPGSNPTAEVTGTLTQKQLNLGLVTGDPGKDGSNVLPTNTAIAQAIRENGETKNELSAAFVRHLPAPTGVATTDTAMLLSYASTPGRNILQDGVYKLNATLPVVAGVEWVGVKPALRQVERSTGLWLADGVFNFESGTVLEGDGTFSAFEANTAPLASPPAMIGDDEIPGFNAYGIGFDNFTYGIHVGGQNHMSISHGNLESLYFKRCSQWGVKIVNFAQMHFDDFHTCSSRGSYFFGAWLAGNVFQPGNSTFGRLYAYTVPGTRKSQGIVFDSRGDNALLNHMDASRMQVNMFGAPLLQITASFTSGSTAIGVPNGTEFEPGMLVQFTATGAGITADITYVVQSVTGNNITVGMTSYSTPIAATATATATLKTHGYPQFAITSDGSGRVNSSTMMNIDAEGATSAKFYAERPSNLGLQIAAFAGISLADMVLRDVGIGVTVNAPNATALDIDGTRDGVYFTGWVGNKGFKGGIPRGSWHDTGRGVSEMNVSPSPVAGGADFQSRLHGFIYPQRGGVGEKISPRVSGGTFSGIEGGNVIYRGTANATYTLPVITTDATPASSILGQWYNVVNLTPNEGVVTVTAGTGQLFNFMPLLSTLTIPKNSSAKFVAIRDHNNNYTWLVTEVKPLAV